MSLREEDRQNKNCPSRGLGLAAAAIGVGVGAALYYFFSKRPENPHEQGSTSNWECEPEQTFLADESNYMGDDSYTTVSEHSTTDTSIHESPLQRNCCCNDNCMFTDDDEDSSDSNAGSYESDEFAETEMEDDEENLMTSMEMEDDEENLMTSMTDESDWDVTNSSSDVPEYSNMHSQDWRFLTFFSHGRKHRMTEEEQMRRAQALSEEEQIKFLRDQAFRERSWSLEECSICFEVILKNQEVMSLPCTHHFHTACILPWLQEQQTCPNCRKAAE